MLEVKASIQSLSLAMQTLEDRIVAQILDGLKSQHDDADDGQHHEPDVDIDDDVLGVDGEHITHIDDVVDASAGGDGEPDSVVAERKHFLPTDAFVDAAVGAILMQLRYNHRHQSHLLSIMAQQKFQTQLRGTAENDEQIHGKPVRQPLSDPSRCEG
ncbi:Uncharacterized protein TCM_017152 [Theobroma cacao]|uniref:Uncharacterized protein n=1 Tax=Theobroma cacao TaxID=3641 RepID=A0A061EKF4_THECC|nr:Uncharacterized protein TCM_017152 [Theobroma cacao]